MRVHPGILLSVFLIVFVLPGCKREGCTNNDAQNFDSNARKDCGCCTFVASHTFWWDENTCDKLRDAGALRMRVFLDGELVHEESTSGFWDSPSYCHEEGSITVTKYWFGTTPATGAYIVKDEVDSIWWSGTLTFQPKVCKSTKLE